MTRPGRAAVALVVLHVAIGVIMLADPGLRRGDFARTSDTARFHAIVADERRPYRDFEVEYPPGVVVIADSADPGDFGGFLDRVIVLALLADLTAAALLARLRGSGAALRYLVISAPLLPLVLTRFDLLPTVGALAAVALLERGRARGGGLTLAAAALTKLFPVVLAPLLAVRQRTRALGWFLGAGALGGLAWIAWGGVDGPVQVMTFRGAEGWHVESLWGGLVAWFAGPAAIESGAWRVGSLPGGVGLLPLLVVLGGVAVIVRAARARVGEERAGGARLDEWGTPAAALVAVLLVGSTLLSPQYLIWLVPWVAIAGADGDRTTERLGVVAVVLTIFTLSLYNPMHSDTVGAQALYWVRNGVLVALVVRAVVRLRRPAALPVAV